MKVCSIADIHRLTADDSGIITLDKEAKGMLLQILRDGKLTKEAGHRLSIKLGLAVITYFEADKIPEAYVCGKGFAALESACLACGLASGCTYWQEYGKHLSKKRGK